MLILTLNCGSSSIKYQVIEQETEETRAKGTVERIGMSGAILTHQRDHDQPIKVTGEILDHGQALEYILGVLLSKNHGIMQNLNEIAAIGHRVVHGGETFNHSVLITPKVYNEIRDCIELAPLHNPANLKGIDACSRNLPGKPQVAVFDTAFHQTLPEKAFLYGLPYVLYKRHKIRRYGFHGTSHFYVSNRLYDVANLEKENSKVITIHLGNGCSMAAIENGNSIDTSMGFTPLEGLLMGTRSGDLDPSTILFIMTKEELTLSSANTLLNKHSGLMGISGVSSDMREIIQEMLNGDKKARNAFDVFCYRVRKYIGSYAAALGGVDGIVFTGGIGENAALVREHILEGLEFLGVNLDKDVNENGPKERRITTSDSRTHVWVIPTNEELVIARDTIRIIFGPQPTTEPLT
ncbi:MAG: acetate kinase [Bacteroidetes bacterium]|nr:acetate kinase [Bacteroidota bacterium]